VEGVRLDGECRHFFIQYLAPSGIAIGIKLTLQGESSLGRGDRDYLQDHGVALQRLATPILTDTGEEAMLDLVPFAGAWWQVAHRDGQSRLIGQPLQIPLPQAHPRTVAPTSIGTDEQPFGLQQYAQARLIPPAANALHLWYTSTNTSHAEQ
jgi:hypothetical protein